MAMRILTTMRTQAAVYWPPRTDETGRPLPAPSGKRVFGPMEFLDPAAGRGVSWFDGSTLAAGVGGMKEQVKAMVFVGEDLLKNGALFLGTPDDVPQGYEDDPLGIPSGSVGVILRLVKTPTFTQGEFVRVVYL